MSNTQINEIATTIYRQIAQSKLPAEPYLQFFKAVKAKDLVELKNGLQFRVKGDKFAGKVVITLNEMDTYDIEFWNIQLGPDDLFIVEKVDEINDIYNDQLLETLWNRIVIV